MGSSPTGCGYAWPCLLSRDVSARTPGAQEKGNGPFVAKHTADVKFPVLSTFPGNPETGVKKEQTSGPVHAPFNSIGCWRRPYKAFAELPSMCATEAIILHTVMDFSIELIPSFEKFDVYREIVEIVQKTPCALY